MKPLKPRHVIAWSVFALVLLFSGTSYYFVMQMRGLILPDLPAAPAPAARMSDLNPAYGERVWIHKVNSVEKMRSVAGRFSGIETDVFYDVDADRFDVCHWPQVMPNGLTLDVLWQALPDPGDYYFWIDFKNLRVIEAGQAAAAARLLGSLAQQAGIDPGRIVVESKHAENLTVMAGGGFMTSYWIPRFPDIPTKAAIKRWQNGIIRTLESNEITTLSGNCDMLPYVLKYFPRHNFMAFGMKSNVKVTLIDEI